MGSNVRETSERSLRIRERASERERERVRARARAHAVFLPSNLDMEIAFARNEFLDRFPDGGPNATPGKWTRGWDG